MIQPLHQLWSFKPYVKGAILRRGRWYYKIVERTGRWRYLARRYDQSRPEGRWS